MIGARKMINYTGAYENGSGSAYCSTCGADSKKWDQLAVSVNKDKRIYMFVCKKCKNKIKLEISREI